MFTSLNRVKIGSIVQNKIYSYGVYISAGVILIAHYMLSHGIAHAQDPYSTINNNKTENSHLLKQKPIKDNEKLILVLMGPPASGKGTVARFIEKEYGIPQISTGQLIRDSLKKATTDSKENSVEKKLSMTVKSGKLVNEEIVNQLVEHRIKEEDCRYGFILDGYPRTIGQAQALENILSKENANAKPIIIVLNAKEKVILDRLKNRIDCANHNLGKIKLNDNEISIKGCTGKEEVRADDSVETLHKRIKIYKKQTKPVIKFYRNNTHDNIIFVNTSTLGIEKIHSIVLESIEKIRDKKSQKAVN